LPCELNKPLPKKQVVAQLVVPGEVICEAAGCMRGHGTYIKDGYLVASVSGAVERVNKFICVRPLKTRFNGDVGDVVVGRVTAVQGQRWKVDTQARQDSVLLLASIDLPGDVRRRRNEQDKLRMRNFFAENDLISAEVQQFYNDQSMSLHTRHKYGKLTHGLLVVVSPALIRRAKTHFITMEEPAGVDILLGNNGYIWLSPTAKNKNNQTHMSDDPNQVISDVESSESVQPTDETTNILPEVRLNMARVRNAILALAKTWTSIHPATISHVCLKSIALGFHPKQMLLPTVIIQITKNATDPSILANI